MNKLFVGFSKDEFIENDLREFCQDGFLYIADELPAVPAKFRPLTFNTTRHSFNPIKDISRKDARELATVLYTLYPQGQDTLTVRNGRRALAQLFSKKFENIAKIEQWLWKKSEQDELTPANAEALGVLNDILFSPVLESVLCPKQHEFDFKPGRVILAHINRAELGDFEALALTFFLISHYKGQLIIPDFGFYGRDTHSSLIRQKRLVAGLESLDDLPPRLRRSLLSVASAQAHEDEKIGYGALYKDAYELALAARKIPDTDGFSTYIHHAMQ